MRTWTSLTLTAVLMASVGAALYSLSWGGVAFGGEDTPGRPGSFLPSPTSEIADPPGNSRAAIEQFLARNPRLRDAVNAVEGAGVDSLLQYLAWRIEPCTPKSMRGGIAPSCESLGLAEGTPVRLFAYDLTVTSYFPEADLRSRLSYWLKGREPRLALVSARSDGRLYLSFTLNGGTDEPGLRGIDFRADPNSATPLLSYTERFVGSTPLDTIRDEQEPGSTLRHDVLYISPALRTWQSESAKQRSQYETPQSP